MGFLLAPVSLLSFRVRSRASLELEVVALRHQVAVLRRQRSGSASAVLRRSAPVGVAISDLAAGFARDGAGEAGDRGAVASQGLPAHWRWRSRSRQIGRPNAGPEIRRPIRLMSMANPIWGRLAFTANCSCSVLKSAKPPSGDTCRGDPRSPPRLGAASYAPHAQYGRDRHVRRRHRDIPASLTLDVLGHDLRRIIHFEVTHNQRKSGWHAK